jgi:hypothetical protein
MIHPYHKTSRSRSYHPEVYPPKDLAESAHHPDSSQSTAQNDNLAFLSITLIAALTLMGCDPSSSPNQPAPKSSHSPAAASTPYLPGNATVRGVVRYEGPTLPVATMPGDKCHTGATAIVDESIVISAAGNVQNSIVYIEGAPAALPPIDAKAAVLDQKDCRYVPHVLAIQADQSLAIRSSDDTLHNVHYSPAVNPSANFGMTGIGQDKTVAFKSAEIFKVSCDVHPWMAAWVGVFENPLFSVTNAAGGYEIKNVPAGKYTLVSWHERFGRQEKAIEIADSQTLEQTFIYKAPG